MARRIELGAGIAAVVLAALAVGVLLFAPIVAFCPTGPLHSCPVHIVRYETLPQAGPDVGVWAYIIGMLLIAVMSATGAIMEARYKLQFGLLLLWTGAIITFMGCALEAFDIGVLFLPTVLALALAAYASLLNQPRIMRRIRAAFGARPSQAADQRDADQNNQRAQPL